MPTLREVALEKWSEAASLKLKEDAVEAMSPLANEIYDYVCNTVTQNVPVFASSLRPVLILVVNNQQFNTPQVDEAITRPRDFGQ